MLRLLLRLFGIKDFEVCQSCETLKQQLEYERSEKKQLTDTLLAIISPKVIEAAPIEVNPITITAGNFARRRAILEQRDREEAKILKQANHLGKPDDNLKRIDSLEKELGIQEESEKTS